MSSPSPSGFTTFSRKKRKPPHHVPAQLTPEVQLQKLLGDLDAKGRRLKDESARGWWEDWSTQMEKIDEVLSSSSIANVSAANCDPSRKKRQILCLGIGKPSESPEAKFQFVLLLDMAEKMEIRHEDIQIFDPLFTPLDLLLMAHHGLTVLPSNSLGIHPLPLISQTLVYLPHCPRELYENFLGANWGDGTWARSQAEDGMIGQVGIVVLGNPLIHYLDKLTPTKSLLQIPHLHYLAPHLQLLPLPELPSNHLAFTAFNSTTFQWLDPAAAGGVDWGSVEEVERKVGDGGGGGEVFGNEIGEEVRGVNRGMGAEAKGEMEGLLKGLTGMKVDSS